MASDYNKNISWLCCSNSFSLVRSAVMCLHGSHSSFHHPTANANVPLDAAICESRVPTLWALNKLWLIITFCQLFFPFIHLSVFIPSCLLPFMLLQKNITTTINVEQISYTCTQISRVSLFIGLDQWTGGLVDWTDLWANFVFCTTH